MEHQVPSSLFRGINETDTLGLPLRTPTDSVGYFSKHSFVHASETLSQPLPGMLWPLLCLEDVHSALLKCPLLHEAFPNFPKQGSLLCTSWPGIAVVFPHRCLVLPLEEGCTSCVRLRAAFCAL